MIAQLLDAVFAVFFGVGACFFYFIGSHFVLERIFADSKGANGEVISRESLRNLLRPWIFFAPSSFHAFHLPRLPRLRNAAPEFS